jgi:hypothetical protein
MTSFSFEGLEKATRGGEWEPIKILCENFSYVPNSTWRASLLTRPRPHSYRQTIVPQNRVSETETHRNHNKIQVKPQVETMMTKNQTNGLLTSSQTFHRAPYERVWETTTRAQPVLENLESLIRQLKNKIGNPPAINHTQSRNSNSTVKTNPWAWELARSPELQSTSGNQNRTPKPRRAGLEPVIKNSTEWERLEVAESDFWIDSLMNSTDFFGEQC